LLYWPIQDLGTERRGCISVRAASPTVRHAQHVPRITIKEMSKGFGGVVATGRVECAG
jgi:hypothetical protein